MLNGTSLITLCLYASVQRHPVVQTTLAAVATLACEYALTPESSCSMHIAEDRVA